MKIYSKLYPKKLLHFINRFKEIKDERHNLISDDNFIQCAAMSLPKGKTFKPHKHFERERFDYDQLVSSAYASGIIDLTNDYSLHHLRI